MSDEAREARAVAEALIQQVPYQDKLVELFAWHRAVYDDSGHGCLCGSYGPDELHLGIRWHAEHLAKIVRGHLRNARIVATAPEPGTDRP